MSIDGTVEPGFEGVREAFARNFTEHGDVGAAFCLHVEGRKVVDLWGGTADVKTGRPYDGSTLQLVFSTTKGATAACANLLAQRGALDLDAPVATYWPEFAAAGKDSIPVRWLLCHKAGLPVIDKRLSLEEALAWEPVIEALAVQQPVWEPGSAHGYHALTYGWLVGEVVRRVDGRSLGAFFAEEIARPLGLDFWIGLPEGEEDRVAPLVGGLLPEAAPDNEELKALLEQFTGPDTLLGRALTLNGAFGEVWNDPRGARGTDRRCERHHEREVTVPVLCRTGRLAARRAGSALVHARTSRSGAGAADRGQRPSAVLRDEVRLGLLHLLGVRPVRRCRLVRTLGCRRFDGFRRSGEPDRGGLRDESHGPEPVGRSAYPWPRPSQL